MAGMSRQVGLHDLRAAQDQMTYRNRMLGQAPGPDLEQPGSGITSAPAWAAAVDISARSDSLQHQNRPAGLKVR
jgi:hypothetical protein